MEQLKWRPLSFAALLITTLLLGACAGESTDSTTSVSSYPVTAASGPVVPDFSVSTGQDTAFSLSDHQGDVVVLYFSFPG